MVEIQVLSYKKTDTHINQDRVIKKSSHVVTVWGTDTLCEKNIIKNNYFIMMFYINEEIMTDLGNP